MVWLWASSVAVEPGVSHLPVAAASCRLGGVLPGVCVRTGCCGGLRSGRSLRRFRPNQFTEETVKNDALALYALALKGGADRVTQERVFKIAAELGDGKLIASLMSLPNLAPEIDVAIGKRPGVKERLAWISAPWRTAVEVSEALVKEKRLAILDAASKRHDLSDEDYLIALSRGGSRVAPLLLENRGTSVAVKLKAAVVWAKTQSNDHGAAYSDYVGRYIGAIPSAHDAVALATRSRVVLEYVSSSELSERAQRRIIEALIKPALAEATSPGTFTGYKAAAVFRRFEQGCIAAEKLALNPSLTADVRTELNALFANLGTMPVYNAYSKSPTKSVAQVVAALVAGASGALTPHGSATNTVSLDELVVFAKKAAVSSDSQLAVAVLANPIVDTECARIVAKSLEYRCYQGVLELLASRNNTGAFAAVAGNWHNGSMDKVLGFGSNPEELLVALVRELETVGGHWHNSVLLGSSWCSPRVVQAMTITAITSYQAAVPEWVSKSISEFLVESFGDNDDQWALFESLLVGSSISFGELVSTVKTLSPDRSAQVVTAEVAVAEVAVSLDEQVPQGTCCQTTMF